MRAPLDPSNGVLFTHAVSEQSSPVHPSSQKQAPTPYPSSFFSLASAQ
jgi:hypothetical protein